METYISNIHREGDRIMSGVAWFLFVLSLCLAPTYGTWSLALTVGLGLAVTSTAAAVVLPARRTNAFVKRDDFYGICRSTDPADARHD